MSAPSPADSHPDQLAADRNLLFGILALQMDFIRRDELIAAMHAWVLAKAKPLGQILLDQGQLTPERLQLLDALVREHLRAHHHDPQQSLAAVPSTSGVYQALRSLGDDELQASLAVVGSARDTAVEATTDESQARKSGLAGRRYRILRSHAKGGLGEVWVAEDQELHREVALKEIQQRHAHDPISRGRFLLEAEVTGRLEHPGIVPVYGLGQYDDGRPFYAMRFVKGDNLKEAIRRFHEADGPGRDPSERSLAFRQLLGRFVDVCHAVAYAHSRGVLHRDLKPGNIMLGKYGETLVVDWGLAKPMDHPELVPTADETRFRPSSGSGLAATQVGAAIGTPAYMSPEQAAGRLDRLGPASDVYSLGATLYALLTGRAPFHEGEMGDVLQKVQRGEVVGPRQLKPAVPKALEAICRQAMALAPEERYPTALALAADVEHWLADEPVAVYPEPWPARAARWARRRRTLLVAASVLLVSAVVALSVCTALVWREQQKTAEQKRLAEQTYQLARDLSFSGIDLIASSEASFASVPALHSARQELLKAASRTCRQYLDYQPNDPDVRKKTAQIYRYTANVHRFMNEPEAAEPLYRDAIRLYEGLADQFPEETIHREKLSETLRDHASLQAKVGRLREAIGSLRQAVAIAEPLRAEDPDRPGWRRTLATALLDLAGAEHAHGMVAESGKTAGRATELFRGLLDLPAKGSHHPYDPLLLAAALNRVAVAERESGRLDAARSTHAEAIKQLQGMVDKQPEGTNRADILHFLAKCRLEQCRTWARTSERRKNAEQNLGAAALQWEGLAKTYPKIPLYREWLGIAYLTRGQLWAEDNRLDEARADFDRSRELFEELVKASPELPDYHGDLGRAYAGLGRLARSAGDRAGASAWFEKAADALRKAVKLSPDHAQDRRSLEEVQAEQVK